MTFVFTAGTAFLIDIKKNEEGRPSFSFPPAVQTAFLGEDYDK